MIPFIGHLHPLFVHLPIGILLLAFFLECLARWFRQEQVRPAIHWTLVIGLAAAVFSASTGWLLAENSGYDETILKQHRWFGLGVVALFSTVLFVQETRWYFPAFILGIIALIATGHFGGSLTHGEGYLFQKEGVTMNIGAVDTAAITQETPIFKGIIQPILQQKCVSCHRLEKRKGNLILDTEAGILAGGKHGNIFIPGQPDSSTMLQRIHLPLHHDNHMPPSTKPQLSALEIKLLEWWISTGADFQAQVKDHPIPEALAKALVESKAAPANPVFSLSVPNALSADLQRLKSLRIQVESLGQGKPWLAVSLAGKQTLTHADWEALEAISEQVTDLDLSHTSVQDQDLNGKNFPHLIRLNLGHTSIGNAALPFFQKAVFLESLNLTNTLLDDALQEVLPKMPQLKRLYLWRTQTTPAAILAWHQQYPNLQIESGADIPDDVPLSLRSPKMLFSRSFFDDTMHLELNFPFKGVEIYYTLEEAASPTTQSPKYHDKLILNETSHLRAFAAKNGWQNSPMVDAVFVKKKFVIANASLSKPPSPKYPAKGAASLIDGKISDVREADTWLGYEGEHLEATLDLGEQKEIGKVYVHCLEHNGPWIFLPVAIQVSTSTDGKIFKLLASEKFAQNASMGEQKVHLLTCQFPKLTKTRYVRVKVESLLKNPPWHPGKGQKCWIFVDEITVE